MASSTLSTKIEDLIGKIDDGNYTAVNEWLTQSARDVINVLPSDMLWTVSQVTADSGSGATINTAKFLYAEKGGYRATEIAAADKQRASNADSIYKALDTSPVYYRESGKVFVLPNGGNVHAVTYPTVTYSSTSISGVPKDIEYIIILGGAVKGRMYQLDILRRSIDNLSTPSIDTNKLQVLLAPSPVIADLEISATPPIFTAPDFPNISDLDLSSISSDLPDYSGVNLQNYTISNLPTAPSYNKPTFVAPAFPSITALDLSGLTIPDYSQINLQDYNISTLPTAPSYTSPDFDISSTTFAAAMSSAKTALDDDDIEKGQGYLSQAEAHITKYSQSLNDATNTFNEANTLYQAQINKMIVDAKAHESEDTVTLAKKRDEIAQYQQQVNEKVILYQQNELGNKFKKWTVDYANALQEYGMNMQNAMNEFNEDNVLFQAEMQKLIHNSEGNKSKDSMILNKLKDEMARYQQKVNDLVTLYQNNELQEKFQKWVTDYSNQLQEYSASIQLYNTKINKEIQEYNLNKLQKEMALYIQKENDKVAKANLESQGELGRFSSEMSKYSAETQAVFSKYSGMFQELQLLQSQYQQSLQSLIGPYNKPRGAENG